MPALGPLHEVNLQKPGPRMEKITMQHADAALACHRDRHPGLRSRYPSALDTSGTCRVIRRDSPRRRDHLTRHHVGLGGQEQHVRRRSVASGSVCKGSQDAKAIVVSPIIGPATGRGGHRLPTASSCLPILVEPTCRTARRRPSPTRRSQARLHVRLAGRSTDIRGDSLPGGTREHLFARRGAHTGAALGRYGGKRA